VSKHCYLATYHPLTKRRSGREAVVRHALPGFIDGSCRREPDFESAFPSITATCRGANFAPRLHVGDRVAYLTVRGKYPGDTMPGWRLVAVLRVVERFESHEAAAEWYQTRGLALPSNCMVPGNPPKPFHLTNGNPPDEVKSRVAVEAHPEAAVRLWDKIYEGRILITTVAPPLLLGPEVEIVPFHVPRRRGLRFWELCRGHAVLRHCRTERTMALLAANKGGGKGCSGLIEHPRDKG